MNIGPGGQAGARGPSSLPNWWPAADPRHNSSSSTSDVMSQLCRVCGEPAAGFHFGAFTCEGCKSFFGRTYNNLSSISECKNNGECVINKKNRTSCKACRLRKCLVVGMSKSGSRYGRRSNWFKIHCLLQEQQQQHHHLHPHQLLQQQQQQQQQQPQHPLQRPVVLGGGVGLHFPLQQPAAAVARTPAETGRRTPPPPLRWPADVKHRLRGLDVDNNNSVAGDLNEDGGRLSAVAAAAVAQAVRPELLRWPSPFFPAFQLPPPGPFFLGAAVRPFGLSPSTGCSPTSRSSCTDDRDDDNDDRDDGGGGGGDERPDGGPASPDRVAVHRRDLPPVQESPMDLSVSAAAVPPAGPSSRSPSPSDVDPCPTDGSASRRTRHRRRRRRHKRRRSSGRSDGRAPASGSSATDSDGSASSADRGSGRSGGERTTKNSPLDLTYVRRQH